MFGWEINPSIDLVISMNDVISILSFDQKLKLIKTKISYTPHLLKAPIKAKVINLAKYDY